MNPTLVAFLLFCAVVYGSIYLFLRGSIRELSNVASAHAQKYASVYARGMVYVMTALLISFIEVFEKLDPITAGVLPWWSWLVLFAKPVASALIALGAYLDNTASKIREAEKPTV